MIDISHSDTLSDRSYRAKKFSPDDNFCVKNGKSSDIDRSQFTV
ncbi:hypothetical protein [Stanieria cyanosphaera]|nr:hypothetical protein [Stanieria cyanosphaera]